MLKYLFNYVVRLFYKKKNDKLLIPLFIRTDSLSDLV